jgi:hypothetical protein
MLIAKLDGSVVGEHQQLFPHTGFPEAGPSDAWLEKNGFLPVPKSAEELAAEVRAERGRRLSETDWMALSDSTMSAEWATYRQALRDITTQEGFPYAVEWPTKPE